MRNDEAESKAEACTPVDGIIRRRFVTVRDMSIFYSELVEALQNARLQGKRVTLTVMPR
jgi:hypothetical protein